MKICNTINELKSEINLHRKANKTLGFVPTMGALHFGHISLIEQARKESDIVICSIFVNPIQFNDPADLEKYPRTVSADEQKLASAGCDILFLPEVAEIYPEPVHDTYDFGALEKVMEGPLRPGHFNGVAVVLKRLFEIAEPHKAFFGEKDYQQLAIVKCLVNKLQIPIEIIGCPIVREADGLAMSSRNVRLSADERKLAPSIYRALTNAKELLASSSNIETAKEKVHSLLQAIPEFNVEYFEIVDGETLQPIHSLSEADRVVGCIAVWVGNVRLIDMIKLK